MFGYNSISSTIPGLSNDADVGDGTGVAVQGDVHARTVRTLTANGATASMGTGGAAFSAGGLIGGQAGVLRAQYATAPASALIWLLDQNGDTLYLMDFDGSIVGIKGIGFWGVTPPAARPVLATGASRTVDNVISLLQLYGLCKQS